MDANSIHHLPFALALLAALPHVTRKALTVVLGLVLVQDTGAAGTAFRTFRDAPPIDQRVANVALIAQTAELVAPARTPQLRAGFVHD